MSQTKAQLLDNIKDNVQLDARNSLRFADTDSSHYVAFKAPATVSSNVTWTLPAADGSANYVLATDGSGTLSWIADPAGQWTTSGSNIYFTGGNVGIGDSSPSNPLSVTGASVFDGDLTLTGSSYNVVWDKSDNALEFADNAKAVFGAGSDLEVYHSGSHSVIKNGTGYLQLVTDSFTVNNNANDENIITALANGEVRLYFDNGEKLNTVTDGVNITGSLQFGDDTNTYLQRSAADTLQIVTGGTAALTVDASQEVGIGTTGPTTILDVRDTSTTAYPFASADSGTYSYTPYAHELNLRNNTTGTDNGFAGIHFHAGERAAGGRQGTARISALYTGEYKADLVFATRNTSFKERMRLTAAGKLGINVAAPENLLHINTSGASGNGIMLKSTDSYYPRITGDANRTTADNFVLHLDGRWNGTSIAQICLETGADTTNKDDGRISFRTASAGTTIERMRIDNTGKVGINTGEGNAPQDWLHINTTDSNNTGLELKSTSNTYSTIIGDANRGAADNYILRVVGAWNATEVAQITIESGSDTTNKDDGQINFWTMESGGGSMVERFSVEADGDVQVKTGNLVIGTGGKGIDFSASGGPQGEALGSGENELLDDYEHGFFTPTISGSTTAGTNISYTTQTGTYIKIGTLVTVSLTLAVNSIDNAAGDLKIHGLPFSHKSGYESSAAIQYNQIGTGLPSNFEGPAMALLQGGYSTILQIRVADHGTASYQAMQVQTLSYLRLTLTYFA